MRTILVLSLLGLALAAAASQADRARQTARPHLPERGAQLKLTGEEPLPLTARKGVNRPAHGVDEVHTINLGTTSYDYQANGSLSKMVAVSPDGVVHGAFMYSNQDASWTDRRIKTWCVYPDLTYSGPTVANNLRSGYVTVAAMDGDGLIPNATVTAFHTASASLMGVDFEGCAHAFSFLDSGTSWSWPHVAVSAGEQLHMVSYDSGNPHIYYQGSYDGGASWDAPAVRISTTSEALGSISVASKTSNRAAVLYHAQTGDEDIPYDGGDTSIGKQIHHDVRGYIADDGDIYAQIANGGLRDFTQYGPGSESPFGEYGCRSYCDIDGVFDRTEDENLHIAFSGDPVWTDSLHVIWDAAAGDSLLEVYYHWTLNRGQIWHHNADTGTWSHIWGHNSIIDPEDDGVDGGSWRMCQDRPSFAVDPSTGYLYCAWTQRLADDLATEGDWGCTTPIAGRIGNGEIYMSCSTDNGLTWGEPVNLTNTHSPDCTDNCLSEDWMSLAENVVDGKLSLTYIEDHSPGGFVQCEGFSLDNPVMFMQVDVADVPPSTQPWNQEGWVGLAQVQRWYRWYAAAWCDSAAIMDSVKWVDPVHVFNESPFDVALDHISWHHSPNDQIGEPEDLGITEVGVEVKTDNGYIPISQWDGVLPQWTATKFNVHFAYSGVTERDVLIGFHFRDDRPSLYYRLDMQNALQDGETEPCTTTEPIAWDEIDQMEETVLNDFTGIEPAPRPVDFALLTAVPNPFNPATTLRYSLDNPGRVSMKVHNLAGQLVATLADGFQGAGWHQVRFDGSALASGVYVCTLEAGGRSVSQKVILAK